MICATRESAASRVARITNDSSPLMAPDNTCAPGPLEMVKGSPVRYDSSIVPCPCATSPSTGLISCGTAARWSAPNSPCSARHASRITSGSPPTNRTSTSGRRSQKPEHDRAGGPGGRQSESLRAARRGHPFRSRRRHPRVIHPRRSRGRLAAATPECRRTSGRCADSCRSAGGPARSEATRDPFRESDPR